MIYDHVLSWYRDINMQINLLLIPKADFVGTVGLESRGSRHWSNLSVFNYSTKSFQTETKEQEFPKFTNTGGSEIDC